MTRTIRHGMLPLGTLPLLAMILLAGCVTFESAPTDALGCDPALIGRWLPEGDDDTPPQPGTVAATADNTCQLTAPERDGTLSTQTFQTFALDDQRYIVVASESPQQVFGADGGVLEEWPASRVALYRYRIDGQRVSVWLADFDTALGLEAPGVVVRSNAPKNKPDAKSAAPEVPATDVYVTGPRDALAGLLRTHGDRLYSGLAPDEATTFLRIEPEAAR